jgi:NAD-dependent deacetylase
MKKKILIFSGAGVSAESGVKTFRDHNGLWEEFNVMEVASVEGWRKDRGKVLDFYNRRRKEMEFVIPNKAHEIIAELEKYFDVTVVTQNVDNLHERAGSTKITHLHGELTKARGCLYSHKSSPCDNIIDIGYGHINVGDKCPVTESQLRPHIVFFGDVLDPDDMNSAKKAASEADVCIVVGTSMQVSPANTIPFLTKENSLIYCIDPSELNFNIPDHRRPFFFHFSEKASTGMEKVKEDLLKRFVNENV